MKHPPKNIAVDWLNTIWETGLPANSKYLACYLRKFMNAHHDMAYPGYERIIHETGLGRTTIVKYLDILESEGWVARERGGKTSTTKYYATFPEVIEDSVKSLPKSLSPELYSDPKSSSGDSKSSPGDTIEFVSRTGIKQGNKQVNKQTTYSNSFEQFWLAWPKGLGEKGSKRNAYKEFTKLNPSPTFLTKISETVQHQAHSKRARRGAGEFASNFKHVERWLRLREWEMDDEEMIECESMEDFAR